MFSFFGSTFLKGWFSLSAGLEPATFWFYRTFTSNSQMLLPTELRKQMGAVFTLGFLIKVWLDCCDEDTYFLAFEQEYIIRVKDAR